MSENTCANCGADISACASYQIEGRALGPAMCEDCASMTPRARRQKLEMAALRDELAEREREVERLSELLWGSRCVYCGEVVGKDKHNQDIADEVLREHVRKCPKHPLAAAEAEVNRLREAAEELLTVAELRGDSDLPHPSADDRLWTARMQTAWDALRAALAEEKGGGA